MIHTPPVTDLPLIDLPVIGADPPERADAARNRRRILAAAERLFAAHGVSCTSMDAIAAEAGVGKGTLFRRFGDRPSLARALLSEHEAAFQEALIRGVPPLGPGAPPRERLIAFGDAMLDHLERSGDLLLAAESGRPGSRFRSAVMASYRLHVGALLREADPSADVEYATDALLAALSAELVTHQRRGRDLPLARLKAGWATLVTRVLTPAPEAPVSRSARAARG